VGGGIAFFLCKAQRAVRYQVDRFFESLRDAKRNGRHIQPTKPNLCSPTSAARNQHTCETCAVPALVLAADASSAFRVCTPAAGETRLHSSSSSSSSASIKRMLRTIILSDAFASKPFRRFIRGKSGSRKNREERGRFAWLGFSGL